MGSTPRVEILYEVGARKGVLGDVPRPGEDGETNGKPVPTDVHKNMEVSDKDLNKNSDEDVGDDAFLDKTAKGKNKKRERTEVDKVSNEDSDVELDEDIPVKKKVKKSPSKAPAKKTTRRKMIPRK